MVNKIPEEITLRNYYAGFISRLLALIIDFLLLAVILAITSVLWNTFVVNFSNAWKLFTGQEIQAEGVNIVLTVVTVYVTFAIYFIFLWTVTGTSIGGMIAGVKIVNKRGKHPTLWQSAIRFFFEFTIPLFFALGALWIFFTPRRRALFDMIAHTYVVYFWEAKPDENFLKRLNAQLDQSEGKCEST